MDSESGYGGLIVAAGALALSGTVQTGGADLGALRWHVAVWDVWFLPWGLLLGTATVAHWRRTRAIAQLRRPLTRRGVSGPQAGQQGETDWARAGQNDLRAIRAQRS